MKLNGKGFSEIPRLPRRFVLVRRVAGVLMVLGTLFAPETTWGGGGPENVLLVVNPRSQASLTVGNYYRALRNIPGENVLYLPWDPKERITDVDRFRDKILIPILEEIERRGASVRIDYVVYSADFPWGIELEKDIQRFVKQHPELLPRPKRAGAEGRDGDDEESLRDRWPKVLTPRGSINGLTYLYAGVLARRPDYYMSLRVNQYMRRATPEQKDVPTLGFGSQQAFGPHGEPVNRGERYLLSTVLAVVADEDTRGNTLEEVLEYLRRSAAADGSFPQGTIYFVQNGDVRSRTRDSAYPEVVEALQALGIKAEIVHGQLPLGKPDCQGVMMGTAQFDWAASGSAILPGAICDHLTSLGGVMTHSAGQTPLTEFLRHGAAAASGTVTEPFAIAEKFPLPTIHLHYARGCSVAEAFYQSVYAPYQLLIVGDPLCRPWANIPRVRLIGPENRDAVRGVITLRAEAEFPRPGLPAPFGGGKVKHFEWYADGKWLGQSGPGESFSVDTTSWDDGYHELRVVAVESGLIGTRGHAIQEIITRNHQGPIAVEVLTPTVKLGEPLRLKVEAGDCLAVVIRHNTRVVARSRGGNAELAIDTRLLGAGPVRLHAIAFPRGGLLRNRISAPLDAVIEQK